MKNLLTKMTRDIDIKKADGKDLVAWYNENSGGKAITKFKDRATAEARCAELKVALAELAGSSSKKGALKAPKAAKSPKEPKGEGESRGRKSAYAGQTIFRATKEGDGMAKEVGGNPRREGTHGHRSFELIHKTKGVTYEAYMAAGGRNNDLAYDVEHGFVTVK